MLATSSFLGDRFYPPVITNSREIYEQNEVVKIGCQPQTVFKASPKPLMQWFLNGVEVRWTTTLISTEFIKEIRRRILFENERLKQSCPRKGIK